MIKRIYAIREYVISRPGFPVIILIFQGFPPISACFNAVITRILGTDVLTGTSSLSLPTHPHQVNSMQHPRAGHERFVYACRPSSL